MTYENAIDCLEGKQVDIILHILFFVQSDDTKHSSNGFMTNFLSVLQTLCQKVTLDKVGWDVNTKLALVCNGSLDMDNKFIKEFDFSD